MMAATTATVNRHLHYTRIAEFKLGHRHMKRLHAGLLYSVYML